MNETQILISLGIGGGLAFILVRWIIGKLVPDLIKTFREEMALERKAHLEAIQRITDELRAMREDMQEKQLRRRS